MFRDALSPGKDDAQRRDARQVNVTSDPAPAPSPKPQDPVPAGAKPEDAVTSKLIVGPDIKLKGAETHGHFEGELTARKQLIVQATGKVHDSVRYGKLKIEEGGEIAGDIGAIDDSGAPDSRLTQATPEASAPDVITACDPFARKAKPPQAART